MGKEQSDSIRPAPSYPMIVPDMIGPYKIESLLEKGGMSVLYLGTHPESKEPTTIKVLSEKYLSQPDIVHRFLMEAEIIAMADHQNIVKLYGHGEWEGGLYIAMEFIQGISLRQYILQTPMSLKRALEMIIDIAYALCHLHTHGVIHRDLKPENILVSDNGVIKVIDFGIAQLLTQSPEEKKNQRPGLVGTPIYMSPEQRDYPESVSYPSDIYSLGIIAYELILGKLSLGQIHLSLMPKGIQKILAKSLQPNPGDRYQDIVDFITDLSAYLHSNAIEKEKLAGDQLSELAESLKNAYQSLHPPPPIWPEIECGIVSHKTSLTSGGFYDFIKLADGRQVVLAGEAVTDSVKGLLYTSVMRGMAKALTKHSDRIVEELYELLCRDHMDTLFALACLILDPVLNRFEYFSCGYGNLLILPHNRDKFTVINPTHKLIGIDTIGKITFESYPWVKNDTLILFAKPYPLNAPTNPPPFIEEQWWIQPFLDRSHTPMPKQLETAYRKAKAQKLDFWQKQAVNMIGIHKK